MVLEMSPFTYEMHNCTEITLVILVLRNNGIYCTLPLSPDHDCVDQVSDNQTGAIDCAILIYLSV